MRRFFPAVAAIALGLLAIQPAQAGAPLKGVDVKLGKNPGGMAAARTSDEHGTVDFGVWPVGNYTVSVTPLAAAPIIRVIVQGGAAAPIEREFSANAASRAAPVAIVSDGRRHITVSVESGNAVTDVVRVKSHSNSTNNH